jgi:hypothetical protein
MSDRVASRRAPARRQSRGRLLAIFSTLALFLIVLALLAVRVADGQDPALRARAAATPQPPRRVLVKRVIERRVIVHLPASAPPQPSQASQQVSSSGGYPVGAAVTRTS